MTLHLESDLWLDQPDAHDRIDERVSDGRLRASDGVLLHSFVDDGFVRVTLDRDETFFLDFDADIERLWRERPADLAISPKGPEGPMAFRDYDGPPRDPGYRFPDLHSSSDRALDLYLDAQIFRVVELILDQPAIAIQSLYFEYGSTQQLHRDPMFVTTRPPSHLLASWIALEDITDDAGPLTYVPGSHRLPYFEFEPDSVTRPPKIAREREQAWAAWLKQTRETLPVQTLTCKRGDAFIWHGGLLHGGMPIRDAAATRKSFVVHYSTAATYHERTARTRVRSADGWRPVSGTTDTVIERKGARGLDSPRRVIAEATKRRTSLFDRIALRLKGRNRAD